DPLDPLHHRAVVVADPASDVGWGEEAERLPLAQVSHGHPHPLGEFVDGEQIADLDHYGHFRYGSAWRPKLHALKRIIIDDHVGQIGRHDEPEVFGGPPGDPGLIGPGSVSWELHSDAAAIAIGGVGAIVMEILH